MTGSGDLYGDAALICASVFIFNGAWLLTVCGLGLSIALIAQGVRLPGILLLLLCLASVGYIAGWFALAEATWTPRRTTSDASTLLALAGLGIAVLAGPVATAVAFYRRNL